MTRNRRAINSPNPTPERIRKILKFPDSRIKSRLFLKSKRVENANSRIRNDITAFAALILCPEDLFLAIDYDYYRVITIGVVMSAFGADTVTLPFASLIIL